MTTPAQQELRDLIAAKIATRSSLFNDYPISAELADAVMELLGDVRDDWDAIDITTYGDLPGTRTLDQRWLVARIPRESRERYLAPDRSVTP